MKPKQRYNVDSDSTPFNPLLFNRTLSQVLKMFIIPEIENRIANGSLKKEALPIEIHQFRASQKREADGRITPIVEIDEEVQLVAKVKLKNKKSPGEAITIQDIYPEEFFIQPPMYDGKPAGYFYWRSMFINEIFLFDLEHNAPDQFLPDLPTKSPFPILEILNADNFIKVVKPLEKFRILVNNNWPPAPGYYPQIINKMHIDPELITDMSFMELVSSIYNRKYWINKMDLWAETDLFPNRMPYIQRAINAHYQDDYIASIHVIVPQFEGIITDYLKNHIENIPDIFTRKLQIMKDLCLSRKVILYPKEVLAVILEFIDTKAFWKHSELVKDQKVEINRHGIAHGAFTGFENKEISLKLLTLFDALAHVLLNDRVVLGNL